MEAAPYRKPPALSSRSANGFRRPCYSGTLVLPMRRLSRAGSSEGTLIKPALLSSRDSRLSNGSSPRSPKQKPCQGLRSHDQFRQSLSLRRCDYRRARIVRA